MASRRRTTVRLPDDLLERLDRYCRANLVSRSAVLEVILERWLDDLAGSTDEG